MKKKLKILIGILLFLFGILTAAPYLFKDKITDLIRETLKENVNAHIDFEDLDISLISRFPSAEVSLNNLLITTYAPFEGDTLAEIKRINLSIPLKSLLTASKGKMDVNFFSIKGGYFNINVNEQGITNYNIIKDQKSNVETPTSESENDFTLSIHGYSVNDCILNYKDFSSGMNLRLENFNHSGSGNLSSVQSNLITQTETNLSLKYNGKSYLNDHYLWLKATIGIDLEQNKFTFLENEALVNQLPLEFNGYLRLNEDNQEIDVDFKTPSSDFKNLLALIPQKYTSDIKNIETNGKFTLEGFARGIIDDTLIPHFDIQITSENASFKHPDLPKSVNHIYLHSNITNNTGITNNTKISIDNISFEIDEDRFNANAFISNPLSNPYIDTEVKGTLNLNNISKAYPIESIKDIQGIINANFKIAFDMESIKQKKYKNTKSSGSLSIANFNYEGEEMANPVEISKAQVTFNTKSFQLNTFEAKTGNSDLKMSGTINNLVGFLLNKEQIKGDFKLNSNNFHVNDFMVKETNENKADKNEVQDEQLKIPSFLDCTIVTKADNVTYDNLVLNDVQGVLFIKDEKVTLTNLSSNMFDGNLLLNGTVSTKTEVPTFTLNMDIKSFDISQSFSQLKLFDALAPIAKVVEGKLNTDLNISGNLNNNLSPNLTTVSGNAISEIRTSNTTFENSKVLSLLDNNMSFIAIDELDLKDIKTVLSFENGKVNVKPFKVNYKDIDVQINGNHGFDKTIDYNLTFNVPAKYLGNDASNLLANLSDKEKEAISVPVTANILGSFTNPKIKTDMDEALKSLTNQLIDQQKNKVIDQGTNELNKLLNLDQKTATDSTKSSTTENAAKSILNSLFKKKKDTID